jgi:hypothetical protein
MKTSEDKSAKKNSKNKTKTSTDKTRIRRSISLQTKVAIISEYDSGMYTRKDLIKKFGVSKQTLSCILLKKDDIMACVSRRSSKYSYVSKSHYDDLEDILITYFNRLRKQNKVVTGPMLQSKAQELAHALGHSEFRISQGWLEKFKKRFGIKSLKTANQVKENTKSLRTSNQVNKNTGPPSTEDYDLSSDESEEEFDPCLPPEPTRQEVLNAIDTLQAFQCYHRKVLQPEFTKHLSVVEILVKECLGLKMKQTTEFQVDEEELIDNIEVNEELIDEIGVNEELTGEFQISEEEHTNDVQDNNLSPKAKRKRSSSDRHSKRLTSKIKKHKKK